MPLSRRGLFGVLAGAPAAAVGVAAAKAGAIEPTKAEIAELVIKVDTSEFDEAMRRMVRVEVQRDNHRRQGDWRAR